MRMGPAIGLRAVNPFISDDQLTFVLIPGAGIDPGAWRWTIAELQARGHRGVAPRLPLDDPDAGPSAHADAVVEAVREIRGPLVVVGQSLGPFAASLDARACSARGPSVPARLPATHCGRAPRAAGRTDARRARPDALAAG